MQQLRKTNPAEYDKTVAAVRRAAADYARVPVIASGFPLPRVPS